MAVYQRINGVWTAAQRPYVKRNGVWTGVSAAYVKRSGAWVQAYEYDVLPPNPPEITLNVVEDFDTINGVNTLKTRYIRVGVRLPGAENDPDAKLVRVLTDYAGAAPTTVFGGTFTSASDATYPHEPWSEWRYNQLSYIQLHQPWIPIYEYHTDTSVYQYKQWPRNATAGTIIKADTTYHFAGWSLDNNGNWSVANQAQIHIAKPGVDMPHIIIKEARFQPNTSGSWRKASGYQSGQLIQQNSPLSYGLWFHGNQITDSVGAQTTGDEKISVRSAQIYVKRENDNGQANANIYLFWHPYGSPGALPEVGTTLTRYETTKVGTLAKGQGKWFDIPTSFFNNMNTEMKGMGLAWKDPATVSALPEDYSVVTSTAVNLRCGEAHVTWTEEL